MEASVLDRQTNIQPWDEKESEKRGGGAQGGIVVGRHAESWPCIMRGQPFCAHVVGRDKTQSQGRAKPVSQVTLSR